MRSFFVFLAFSFGSLTLGCQEGDRTRGGECLAPANAGGGWDLTCRALAATVPDRAIQVTNLPGAGGGIAFAHVVAQRHADNKLIVAASPATTLRLAQQQFGDFVADDVEWLAAIAADYGVLVVRADAPWKDLPALMAQWQKDVTSIVVSGGSAVGGQDHMKILLLGRAAEMNLREIRYVPYDGGGEAITALLGGFVQAASADASEVLPLWKAGSVRILAVLSPSRIAPPLNELPTAAELGYPVEWVTWRGFYGPPGISQEARNEWLEMMEQVAHSDRWSERRERLGLAPFFLAGDEFEAFVFEQVDVFSDLTKSLGLSR